MTLEAVNSRTRAKKSESHDVNVLWTRNLVIDNDSRCRPCFEGDANYNFLLGL
jgi:hypothetical protein